ncbi:hypothetical protein M5689_005410 [Euphorbia peplus]|nr:hypothetical protein M5689_005410 [Euphorbia peplus]
MGLLKLIQAHTQSNGQNLPTPFTTSQIHTAHDRFSPIRTVIVLPSMRVAPPPFSLLAPARFVISPSLSNFKVVIDRYTPALQV